MRLAATIVACGSFALVGILNIQAGATRAGIAAVLVAVANALFLL